MQGLRGACKASIRPQRRGVAIASQGREGAWDLGCAFTRFLLRSAYLSLVFVGGACLETLDEMFKRVWEVCRVIWAVYLSSGVMLESLPTGSGQHVKGAPRTREIFAPKEVRDLGWGLGSC